MAFRLLWCPPHLRGGVHESIICAIMHTQVALNSCSWLRHDRNPDVTSSMDGLPPQALDQVADFFRTWREPARPQILEPVAHGEHNVRAGRADGYSIANVSRHLSQLQRQGFVLRESRGNNAYYRIADPAITNSRHGLRPDCQAL